MILTPGQNVQAANNASLYLSRNLSSTFDPSKRVRHVKYPPTDAGDQRKVSSISRMKTPRALESIGGINFSKPVYQVCAKGADQKNPVMATCSVRLRSRDRFCSSLVSNF